MCRWQCPQSQALERLRANNTVFFCKTYMQRRVWHESTTRKGTTTMTIVNVDCSSLQTYPANHHKRARAHTHTHTDRNTSQSPTARAYLFKTSMARRAQSPNTMINLALHCQLSTACTHDTTWLACSWMQMQSTHVGVQDGMIEENKAMKLMYGDGNKNDVHPAFTKDSKGKQ